ncbi:MAG: YdbC family protein [Candidatus Goldiibacteriota bacterium]
MPEIKWDIKKTLGPIGDSSGGWKKEVNIVSWNDRAAKIDIRPWDPEHKKMGKGITLNKEEALALKAILNETDFNELEIS